MMLEHVKMLTKNSQKNMSFKGPCFSLLSASKLRFGCTKRFGLGSGKISKQIMTQEMVQDGASQL